jgi:hypothetical protein
MASRDSPGLSTAAGHDTAHRVVTIGSEKAAVTGMLLDQVQGVTWEALEQCSLNKFHCIAGENAPKTGGASWMALDATPQELHSGGIFRTEELDSVATDDSDISM